jgi:hypothetical protein
MEYLKPAVSGSSETKQYISLHKGDWQRAEKAQRWHL